MNQAEEFRPLRPLTEFARFNPRAFDSRELVYIPDLGIDNSKIRTVSPRKVDLIGIKVYRSTVQTIPNTTTTPITFNATKYCEGFVQPTGATFTTVSVPYDGIYLLTANIEWEADDGGRSVWFYINGVEKEGDSRQNAPAPASFAAKAPLVATRQMTAGDTVELDVRQSSGVSLNVQAGEDQDSLAITYMGSI